MSSTIGLRRSMPHRCQWRFAGRSMAVRTLFRFDRKLQKIMGANQDKNVSNEFYNWIEEIYATSMSVAIRRQVDGSKDSISFRRFLEEVGRHPCVVTRKRYSTFFSSSSAESIKSDFDGLV